MTHRRFFLCSSACSLEEFNRIVPDDRNKTAQSIQKFYRVLCDGFVRNNQSISVFSKRPSTYRKTGKRFLPSKDEIVDGIKFHYSRVFNIKGLDILYSVLSSFFWFLNPFHCKTTDVVIFDPLNLSVSFGCYLSCKLRGIPTCAFVTDVITHYSYESIIPSGFRKMSYWVQTHADSFIFMTEQMNDIANPLGKPYIVIEGFADYKMREKTLEKNEKYQKKVCLYAGGLAKHYGLDMLVNGFVKANIQDSELHIYGSGSYSNEIEKLSKQHEEIKFYGIAKNAVIVKEEMKATLLINPRYTNGDYTKYSFPSKNLEYMASGTATLTTRLPGMPHEYYPYVYILEDETVDGMAKILKQLLNKPANEIHLFGQHAKNWMMEYKNNKVQVCKIIDFFNCVF